MRLGYYKLNRPKDKAGKWIWILDHSVQIGPEKCLLILGIQHNKLPKNRPLNYSDVEPLELFPVTKSNGDIVYKQLEETIKKTGIPSSIVADHGGDIKSGIDKFCKQNNETIYIHDVKHKMALLLKKFLNKDERWNDFTRQANSSKAQMQQTELAPLSPPAQRSKARYMNIEHLLNWAAEVLLLLDAPERLKQNDINPKIAETKLSWLKEFSGEITLWNQLKFMVGAAESHIRNNGVYLDVEKDVEVIFKHEKSIATNENSTVTTFKNNILGYLKESSSDIKVGEKYLGCATKAPTC